ncbi:MAG: hypothetical protein R3D44_10955 [Hyphomicrobiaceae bacterium]
MNVRAIAAVMLLLAGSSLACASAWAGECYSRTVRAKGGYSVLEATAKSRARTAWIKRVRADKRLGKTYAAWLRARSPAYTCRKHGKRVICEASAVPCRLGPVEAK